VEGNATITLSVIPPKYDLRYPNNKLQDVNLAYDNPIIISQDYSFVSGQIYINHIQQSGLVKAGKGSTCCFPDRVLELKRQKFT